MHYALYPKPLRLIMSCVLNIFRSFFSQGVSLMALLEFSARRFPQRCALVSEDSRMTYAEMHDRALRLASFLHSAYHVGRRQKVALLCRNHSMSALLTVALSRLGADIILVNTDASATQVSGMLSSVSPDFFFYDEEYSSKLPSASSSFISVEQLHVCFEASLYASKSSATEASSAAIALPRIFRGGNITVFTGGSSGNYKAVTRQSKVFQFLPPLLALLKDIRIHKYRSVLISLPFYHGFGLAAFAVSLFLGKKICLQRHFSAADAVRLVHAEGIEVLPVVPAMLSRMLLVPDSSSLLRSVRCIICGGDVLQKRLALDVRRNLGDILFNLYGTTETGFFMIATPADLSANDAVTLGRPIAGLRCRIADASPEGIADASPEGIGMLQVRPFFSSHWQSTGDRVQRNSEGFYFYHGRADSMVVCGGENVYPENLQRILNEHPDIIDSLAFPVSHPAFGHVLNAQVELRPSSSLTPHDILLWLKPRVSRAEMPHSIIIAPIPLLSTGKKANTIA